MWCKILIYLTILVAVYIIGYIRGVYKSSDAIVKAYIIFKKQQGISFEDISKDILEILKIKKTLKHV